MMTPNASASIEEGKPAGGIAIDRNTIDIPIEGPRGTGVGLTVISGKLIAEHHMDLLSDFEDDKKPGCAPSATGRCCRRRLQ
jgi:hypothetical protein